VTLPKQPNGQIRASATGNPTGAALENETTLLCTDLEGRAWARLHDGTAPVGPLNGLDVEVVASIDLPVHLQSGVGTTSGSPIFVSVVDDLDDPIPIDPGGLLRTAVSYVGATRLVHLSVTNTVATSYYVQIFDRATALAGGETPNIVGILPASGSYSYTVPRPMSSGIVWAISSTPATYTAIGSDIAWTNVVRR